ncbi:cytochrome P450 [Streptomyces sp. NPDC096311]|uniref:cytochrome P450 n=1 Tax=Streptomyces sp. NPDC096311 TaxID=3366083 RepID=UPI003816A3AF
MSTVTHAKSAPDFPATRGCPYAPPELYSEAREGGVPVRVTLWDGSTPWLITRHDHVQQVLGDSARFSADVTKPGFPRTNSAQPEVEGGLFFRQDGPGHLPVRRILNPDFTAKRSESWRPRIVELTDEIIDRLLQLPRPFDIIEHFALALPTAVICEVLGVGQDESHIVHGAAQVLTDLEAAHEDKIAATEAMSGLLHRYAETKLSEPDEMLLSRLVNVHVAKGDITFEQAVRLGVTVIGAGHETTANMLGLGIYALLREPEQRRILVSDPDKYAASCVEEVLRYWSMVQTEPRRVTLQDTEIGGELIRAGEGVLCSLPAANHDPLVFAAPGELDITRAERRHIAFGHGIHQCMGQNLSRVEMQVAWPRLFQRIPGLRLAVPEEELRFHDLSVTYGLHELPVTW